MPGKKKRVALFHEHGERVRGRDNKMAAEVALACEKLSWANEAGSSSGRERIVARICSEDLQYCELGFANGTISRGRRDNSSVWLNDLCQHCGMTGGPTQERTCAVLD